MAFNLYCNGAPSVDDYTKTEGQTNITELMLNDFIEKVAIHEAEGGRTKDRIQQVDIYFNFIGNFVLPLSEDEYKAILEKGRQNNRKRAEKMRELRMSDPAYRAKMEEKERLALERKRNVRSVLQRRKRLLWQN